MNTHDTDRFLPKREVYQTTGLSPATLWREVRAGRFPKQVRLSPRRVGWVEAEVKAWMKERLGARYGSDTFK